MDISVLPEWLVEPKKIVDVELTRPLHPIPLHGYKSIYALVRYQQHPLGWVLLTDLDGSLLSADALEAAIAQQFGDWESWHIPQQMRASAAEPIFPPQAAISIVVCTRDRTDQLRQCLHHLLALEYSAYEIIVVDNAPTQMDTRHLVRSFETNGTAGPAVRYVCEERAGLDWARNRGICAAQYDIIAFTDDDARADRNWLSAIARAFADETVMAVTGPVLPAELETAAQNLFEFGYGGMSHGLRPRTVQCEELRAAELLWASSFGVGASMAFRRALFETIGDFNVALDVGTPSGGGGDIEMFYRTVSRGHKLYYDPAVLVWHTHRSSFEALRRQLYDNGRGFGSYLWSIGGSRRLPAWRILYFALRHWLWPWLLYRLMRPQGFPRSLIWAECIGALHSPFAYQAARRHTARYGKSVIIAARG